MDFRTRLDQVSDHSFLLGFDRGVCLLARYAEIQVVCDFAPILCTLVEIYTVSAEFIQQINTLIEILHI